ncbi:TPA: hypothetical protein ACOSBP_004852 [Enterobacter hormaechei]|uniref:hypothetical protein n=1 Tax=Enterobacter cloacae complex TaxID=354276 RepID=UPI00191BF5BC|nr:hypothetical protein [Enterobacter cloacae]MCV2343405.1 hypothetical protein [Enterobacter hormaechei]ELG6440419.1 hypothetical protein [Enterobacter cloacae]MBW4229146.1 hypothetical protein [Enterobacter cloacae subsp. cloacae]MCQ4400865.1 hypothetical protein [Enterobacter cloacae]MDQ2116896.1 hypothetical protein [Enterobacter hormaechei]
MKLFEMEGFLRGKCLPGDMKVNETNAEYLVRKFTELEQKLAESQREFRAADATIENLQMKLEKMAAENAGLKSAIDATIGWQQSTDPENVESVRMLVDIKTPATDAFLAEVRASEIDSLAGVAETMLVKFSNQQCSSDMHEVVGWKMVLQQANNRAAQHRKGVQS